MHRYPNEKLLCKIEDGKNVSVFHPSLFCVIPKNSGNLETEHGVKLRFFYRMLIGYRIYVMRREDEFISYAMFQKGKIVRYPFVERNMLLMGPYFVSESHRGQGCAKRLLDIALADQKGCAAVFAWVVSDNESSRRALIKTGFYRAGWMDCSGYKKKIIPSQTHYEVWKKNLTI